MWAARHGNADLARSLPSKAALRWLHEIVLAKYHNTGEDIRRILMKYSDSIMNTVYTQYDTVAMCDNQSSRIIENSQNYYINPTKR